MFTNKKAKYYGDNKVLLDSACLSSDTKPTTGVANGSKCIEMDTGKTYMFNEEDSEWEELPSSGGGGGGGSSDFSTATVTLTNSSDAVVYLSHIIGGELEGIVDVMMYESGTYNVVLYEGYSYGMVGPDSSQSLPTITVTGDIENDSGFLTVTGDCTITLS